ncbi:MAG: YbgC/FadM family acyl-CoA thioesterase [Spirochaetota bacterium]
MGKTAMSESGFWKDHIYYYQQRIYFSDTDAGGIVYHARYLDITEHARTELLRSLGAQQSESLADGRIGFVVSSLTIDYKQPAYLDDLVTVETELLGCKRFSLTLEQRVKKGEELLARQTSRIGCVDLELQRPAAIPPAWQDQFFNL